MEHSSYTRRHSRCSATIRRLRIHIGHLLTTGTGAAILRKKEVTVKLSGDGTHIGKRLHVLNFTFTVLEEGSRACSCEGNHILALLKEPENYDSLMKGLSDLRNEVAHLKAIDVNDITYKINHTMGGDWKFLAIVTGIDSAKADFACIWCKCPKSQRHIIDKVWSISDMSHGARTIDKDCTLSKKRKKEFNVSHKPLFPSIPLTHVVIDNLHVFLRVSDVLIDLLILELKRQDCIDKVKKFTAFEPQKYRHLDSYQNFASSLGVPGYQFLIGRNSKELKIRSLTGPERLKLFRNIKIKELLPKFNDSEVLDIQILWTELLELNTTFSKCPEEICEDDISKFETDARNWCRKFLTLYHQHNITPYIHAMANHVGEFMRVHGSILPFTQQGLEKYNDMMTKEYFCATCHRNDEALIQIIQKQNRLEHRDSGPMAPKCFEIRCSNCSQTGHNKLTCSLPCRQCNTTPFKDHLTLIDGHTVPACTLETS